jgi:hypothetical protein
LVQNDDFMPVNNATWFSESKKGDPEINFLVSGIILRRHHEPMQLCGIGVCDPVKQLIKRKFDSKVKN